MRHFEGDKNVEATYAVLEIHYDRQFRIMCKRMGELRGGEVMRLRTNSV
jgi:hypothetical protein